ncbi:TPA: hypothetical protein ACH3X1_008414 [Trebouxia sp. C0004]
MLRPDNWMLALGFIFCCVQACILGATSLCVVWGPLVGGRVLKYRTALLLEVTCQIIGIVAFGPHHLSPYSGVIKAGMGQSYDPELVIYSLLCAAFVLPLWHLLAYWMQVPICPFTQLACSLAGTALVYPGPGSVEWGSQVSNTPPFLSGLGPVYIGWIIMPMVALRLPLIGCFTAVVNTCYILYALVSPTGFKLNNLSPQGVIIVLCVCGTVGCMSTGLFVPLVVKGSRMVKPPVPTITRMNLLGLTEEVTQELEADQRSPEGSGLRYIWDRVLQRDIFAVVSRSEPLMRMQTTAEQFDPVTECLLGAMQVPSAMLLSLAYGGNMFRSALGTFAAILNIYMTAAVADTISVPIWIRCIAAVFTVSGAIVGGARLMPVTGSCWLPAGVQLAKMTPFRSYVVIMGSCVAAVFGKAVGLDSFPVYISVSAIVAVGMMEGVAHVNWNKYLAILAWWYLGCIPLFAITALFTWQGTQAPSAANFVQIQADYNNIRASNVMLNNALGKLSPKLQQGSISQMSTNPSLAELEMLQLGVQQLLSAYNATLQLCTNHTA